MRRLKITFVILSILLAFAAIGCVSNENTEPVKGEVNESQGEELETGAEGIETETSTPSTEENINVEPEILSSNSYSNSGNFYIVGEIKNNFLKNIEFVKVVATYYDEKENVIGTSYAYTILDTLKPNQTSPFEVSNFPDTFVPHSYKIQASYSTAASEPYNGLKIKSHTAKTDKDYYAIVGEVENNGDRDVNFVKVVATFYDEKDQVIGTAYTYTSLDSISPGGTSPFELSSFPRSINPTRYDIQVQAQIQES